MISGAARGLGADIARLFHAEGARVVLGDVRDEEGQSLAKALGDHALYVHLDVTREEDWTAAVAAARARFGSLSVLVNNAGIYRTKPMRELSTDEYLLTVRVNQLGVFLGMRSCIDAMHEAGGGSIVNVASTAGIEGVGNAVHYTASKHAVVGMTRAAAIELAVYGIRVNVLCPGAMATPLIAEAFHTELDKLVAQELPGAPLRRWANPQEVARAALFLASDDSSYMTGAELRVDGGATAGVTAG